MDRFEDLNAARMSAAGEGLTEPHYNLRTFPCADADKSGQYSRHIKTSEKSLLLHTGVGCDTIFSRR